MVEFNEKKFIKDLLDVRGRETQDKYANKLGIKRPTLSLIENGKQLPTLDLLSRFCELSGHNADEYFEKVSVDSLVYLMGSMDESDKIKIEDMAERIRIREKYEYLAKRGNNDNN